MSVYTTQVRWIIESGSTLSLNTYPIFQESYRAVLNQKIIQHFYFREIGFETVGLFNNRLQARMNEIMPYFNKLYESQLLTIDPFITKKYQETFLRNATDNRVTGGTEEASSLDTEDRSDTNQAHSQLTGARSNTETQQSSVDGSTKSVGSDTPQGLLAAENIDSDLYASQASLGTNTETSQNSHDATEDTSSTTDTQGSAVSNTRRQGSRDLSRKGTDDLTRWEEFTRSIEGYEGVNQSELLLKFRETFINVDAMVIEALEDLFMQIW